MATLTSKTALITGASRGIGRATAKALAKAGARVIVHDGRAAAEADALVKEIRASGGQADAASADLSLSDGVADLATQVRAIAGEQLDVLVSNAGISKAATIGDHTVEDFDRLFATNVRGPFFLIQQLLPILREGSNIIVISSAAARTAVGKPGVENPSILAYAAAKGAIETLVKYWAAILGPQGIRVNAVAPGVIDTDMSSFTKTEAGREVALGMQAFETNRHARRCCGRRRVPGVRCGAMDHWSEHSSRWRVKTLTRIRTSLHDSLADLTRRQYIYRKQGGPSRTSLMHC